MPKLLEEVRDLIRTRHYSYRTEEAYLYWIRQYILFTASDTRRNGACRKPVILTHLAVKRGSGSPPAQNQALTFQPGGYVQQLGIDLRRGV